MFIISQILCVKSLFLVIEFTWKACNGVMGPKNALTQPECVVDHDGWCGDG